MVRHLAHVIQQIADAVGTAKTTVRRDLTVTSATGPNGPVAVAGSKATALRTCHVGRCAT